MTVQELIDEAGEVEKFFRLNGDNDASAATYSVRAVEVEDNHALNRAGYRGSPYLLFERVGPTGIRGDFDVYQVGVAEIWHMDVLGAISNTPMLLLELEDGAEYTESVMKEELSDGRDP